MEVDIGSNVFHDTPAVLVAHGEEQVSLEVGEDGQALLSMTVYDANGVLAARLKRNAWVFNNADRFSIKTNPAQLQLIEGPNESESVVLEVHVESRTKISVPFGRFYTSTGFLISINPDSAVIGGVLMSRNTFHNVSNGIVLAN